jgi:hypothetical protein
MSVKMTRQSATSKPHSLGMTRDTGTVARYIEDPTHNDLPKSGRTSLYFLPSSTLQKFELMF